MHKLKGHKASEKRFRVTGTGKLRRIKAGKKHLNGHKTGKRKRQLRQPVAQDNAIGKRYVHILSDG